jgi:hypothetical protein
MTWEIKESVPRSKDETWGTRKTFSRSMRLSAAKNEKQILRPRDDSIRRSGGECVRPG